MAIFAHDAEKLSDFNTTVADLKIPPGPQSEKQQLKEQKAKVKESEREANQRGEEKGEAGSRNLQ